MGYKGCDHWYTIKFQIFEHLHITISYKPVFATKAFVFKYPYDMFNVESSSDASCHRTDQFIRVQVRKQSPKRSNSRTCAHINPVVNWNHDGFQTNLHTTKITVIQHNISYVTTFRRRSQIDYINTESSLLQNKSCNIAEANSLTHTHEFNTSTSLLITSHKSIQIR